MKKEILVTYEETLTRTVTLTIDDEQDVINQVRQAYQAEQIVLDNTDLQTAQFMIDSSTIYDDWVTI